MGQRLGYSAFSGADGGVRDEPGEDLVWLAPADDQTNYVGPAQPMGRDEAARRSLEGWIPVADPEGHNRQFQAQDEARTVTNLASAREARTIRLPEMDLRPGAPPGAVGMGDVKMAEARSPPARRASPAGVAVGEAAPNPELAQDSLAFLRPKAGGVDPSVAEYVRKKYRGPGSSGGELRAAQGQAAIGRLMAASNDAGARLADIIAAGPGGRRTSQGDYDSALSARYAEAEQPVKDVQARLGAAREQAQTDIATTKARQESEASDPTSPTSRRLQAALARLPSFRGVDLSGVAASQVPILMKAVEAEGDRDSRRQIAADAVEARRDAMRDSAATRAASREQALMMFGQRQAERKDEQIDKQAAQFGEKYAAGGTPEAMSALSTVDSILQDPKYKGDLPGVGTLAGLLPDALTSKDGQRLRMAAGQLLAQYQKGISGSGMSDSERENFRRITGLMNSGTEEQFKQGVDLLRQAMSARAQALAGAASPAAVQRYAERNPGVRQALSAPPPEAGAAARVTSDADFAALPSGTVFVGPDGKRRRKP